MSKYGRQWEAHRVLERPAEAAASDSEFEGAKRVIAALVRRYGPCELTVDDILTAQLGKLHIATTVDGFTYRYEAAQAPSKSGGSDE